MSAFYTNNSIKQFQEFVGEVYSLPNDRFYSGILDLGTQVQRFGMRALKGIRKGDDIKTKNNLIVSFSWMMSICNRLHIDIEEEIWKRFPYKCSYCGMCPCACKKIKSDKRQNITIDNNEKPDSLKGFQEMFNTLYPADKRTLADSGVHLAEEIGEVNEALHNYSNEHKDAQFDELKLEISDFVSCIFGVANSLSVDIAEELSIIFNNNCHICHNIPCNCSFSSVIEYKS